MIPKSKRCTSRCPVAGWLTCSFTRNHSGVCEAGGHRWYRGHGYSKPFMVREPEPKRGRLVFGVDREPDPDKRWDTRSPQSLSDAAYRRWIRGGAADPGITLATCDGCGQPFGLSTDRQRFEGTTYHDRPDGPVQHRIHHPADQCGPDRTVMGGKAHRHCVDREGNLIRPFEGTTERNAA